ncbi:MAG: hypothetical protein QT05_C0032G0006 [archaeon GW2011_AR13]|nr:MAG: hypothetical protein QT05_C0032G0006 [archaeon GW2011_AR13]
MKRGQVTLFIIMGMMIIILGILLFLFSPKIQDLFLTETKNPSSFIQDCIEEDISLAVNVLSLNGGSINPEHYFVYDGSRLEYLCYIEGFYQTCVVQQPMLKRHIEMEIEKAITQKSEECFADLKESYERKGYQVSLSKGEIDVELLPQKIVTTFNNSLTLTKESTESYKYHDLKVEKKVHSEGTTVYVLTDRDNLNKFQFASRSVAWPPGYGF